MLWRSGSLLELWVRGNNQVSDGGAGGQGNESLMCLGPSTLTFDSLTLELVSSPISLAVG